MKSTEKKKKTHKKIEGLKSSIAAAAIIALVGFLLSFFSPLYTIDRAFTDKIQYTGDGSGDSKIKIVAVDEKTIAEYGNAFIWDRSMYADFIDAVMTDDTKPLIIAFDIMYVGNTDPKTDKIFADACKRHGTVVTGANLVYGKDEVIQSGDESLTVKKRPLAMIEYPYGELGEVSYCGFTNTVQDSDGYIRNALVSEDYNGKKIYSFSYEIYRKYCELTGKREIMPKLTDSGCFGFSYAGAGGSFETISFCDVLDGTADPKDFDNAIVLVGAYAPGMQDAYNVPVSRGEQMYGVEVQANILQSLMAETTFTQASSLIAAVQTAAAAFVFTLFCAMSWPVIAFAALIILIASAVLLCHEMFINGTEVGFFIPALMFITGYIYGIFGHYLLQQVRSRQVLRVLNQYVAPEVVNQISVSGDFRVALSGENREIAVLFTDIRGFTSMSEGLAPEEVVGILNEYLGLVTKAIFDNGGTLDKYIGDAAMAIFNAPFDLEDFEYRAVCTARDILMGEKALSERLTERFGRTISFGIGINLGPAVVGNIGCEFRKDYTAIGDTVNTAARLQASAGPGQVLISSNLYERLEGRIRASEMGALALKGKSKEVVVYQLDEVL